VKNVEERVKDRLPDLFVTLVSVLTALVLADLVTEARARMRLWPLDLQSLRTWSQLTATGLSVLVSWIQFSHVGVARHRLPTLGDSLVTFAIPLAILIVTTFIGRNEGWTWFYAVAAYLVAAIVTVVWHFRLAMAEPELARLKAVLLPTGALGVLYVAAPVYGAAGWADQHGWLSPLDEVLLAAAGIPASFVAALLFFRDWRRAIAAA